MRRNKIAQLLVEGIKDSEVTVCGWVRTKRVSKNVAFIAVSDGSTQSIMQIVIGADTPAFSLLDQIHTGSAVSVNGLLRESPAKGQKWEIEATELKSLGASDGATYPLQKKGHSLEFLREIAHLRPRTNTFGAMFRLRNEMANGIHDFFQSRGFIWAHTPLLTSSDGEGAGEMFQVTTLDLANVPKDDKGAIDYKKDFFGKKAHLCVTGQLEGEFMAMSMGDIYTFGPTFRAENSNTTRHLAEFWMVEPEMAFADLEDDMVLAEDMLKHLMNLALTKSKDELEFFEKFYKGIKIEELQQIASSKFHRVTYTDAVDILLKSNKKFENPVSWGVDFHAEHERHLCEDVFKGPTFLTDFPKEIKAFYMKLNPDEKTVAAMDLLVPRVGELMGGSQREDNYDLLVKQMQQFNVPQDELNWYLDLRKYGSAPHAGFGLGFERLLSYVSGMANIRDTIMCPRTPGMIDF